MNINWIWYLGLGYLLGSIPFALVIGKLFYKTDVRNFGSGNLGGTNAGRVLGKKAGISSGGGHMGRLCGGIWSLLSGICRVPRWESRCDNVWISVINIHFYLPECVVSDRAVRSISGCAVRR